MLKQTKISVIGGGLSGLAFAQALRLFPNFKVTVFERDQGPLTRNQGYQIGLNEDGITALKKLDMPQFDGLIKENVLFGFMMTDKKLDPLVRFAVPRNTKENPTSSLVNRFRLRDMLLSGIDVQWNKKFVSYEEKNENVVITFEDGTTDTADLLVGADGVNSKVRQQYRPDLLFAPTGITSIAGYLPMTNELKTQSLTKINEIIDTNLGRAQLPHTNSMLFMKFKNHIDGQDNLLWSISYNTEIVKSKFGDLSSNSDEMKEQLMKRLVEWGCDEEFVKAIELTPNENLIQPWEYVSLVYDNKMKSKYHIRPDTIEKTRYRVVLLGDAAHAMTTHAGRGANTAFCDAIQLRDILVDDKINLTSGKWVSKGHVEYEEFMWRHGVQNVKVSMENTQRIHKDNNEGGITFLRYMGNALKCWNWVTKGEYKF